MTDEAPQILEENWQAKAEEYLAGWKRATADYQNREKEIAREREDMALFATRGMILDFLPVLDNLQAAYAHSHEPDRGSDWGQGLAHVIRQFEEVLKSYGVTPMETMGHLFDPARHEAVGEEAGELPGTVLREVQVGYLMQGKILRPAKVIISK